jgi:hypothetical protein
VLQSVPEEDRASEVHTTLSEQLQYMIGKT